MPYPALLTLHLLAIALFVAGLALAAGSLPGLTQPAARDGARDAELARLRAINRYGTTPALLVVWACGIAMAIEGGWFQAGWLHAKLALVVVLSGLHGYQTRSLRRLSAGLPVPRATYRPLVGIALLMIAIILLATAKPL